MNKMLLAASAATVALWANAAPAATYVAGDLMKPYMTYTSDAGVATHRTTGYNGVGSVYIQTASTGSGGFICTGALLNSTTVLTAAHCVFPFNGAGQSDPVTRIRFILPSIGDYGAAGSAIYQASEYAFNPGYDTPDHAGDIGSGYDVALFTLNRAATGRDTYELYLGDPLRAYTEIGAGSTGGPSGTDNATSDYAKRYGANQYEYYGDDIFGDVSHGVVLYDFDDGTRAHDVFGRNCLLIGETAATCKNQTGIADESSASPGDSGGPEFIDGKIVSVTSFGISGGIFQGSGIVGDPYRFGYCGADSTDPYNAARGTAKTPIGNCTNSSVGEIGGNTLVSYNLNFINAYLDGSAPRITAVPEPATWAMMIAGFGLVGGALRRRRTNVAFAA